MHPFTMDIEDAAQIIVDTGFQLHRALGPGLLKGVYQVVLARDLMRRGLAVESRKAISFDYDGLQFDNAVFADIVVEGQIIIEVTAVKEIPRVHYLQLRSYLKLMSARMGFLMNFGDRLFKMV